MRPLRVLMAAVFGLLGALLGATAAVTLTIERALLQPAFLTRQLAEAQVIERWYEMAAQAGADELLAAPLSRDNARRPPRADLVADLEALLETLAPPTWLRGRAQALLEAARPYLLGRREGFNARLEVGPRAVESVDALARWMASSLALVMLHEGVIARLVDDVMARRPVFPLALELERSDMRGLLDAVAPRERVLRQLIETLDRLIAYLVGDAPRFALLLPQGFEESEREQALRALLEEVNTRRFLIEHVVRPAVHGGLGAEVALPWGLRVSEAEIIDAFAEALEEDWLARQRGPLIEAVTDYLMGRRDTMRVRIDLVEPRERAVGALARLLVKRFNERAAALPRCPSREVFHAQLGLPEAPLACGAGELEMLGVATLLSLEVAKRLRERIAEHVPDVWVYTEAQMARNLGPRTTRDVQRLRRLMREGIDLDDAEIEALLTPAERSLLAGARRVLAREARWTERDLAEAVGLLGVSPDDLEALRARLAWVDSTSRGTPAGALLALIALLVLAPPGRKLDALLATLFSAAALVLLVGLLVEARTRSLITQMPDDAALAPLIEAIKAGLRELLTSVYLLSASGVVVPGLALLVLVRARRASRRRAAIAARAARRLAASPDVVDAQLPSEPPGGRCDASAPGDPS